MYSTVQLTNVSLGHPAFVSLAEIVGVAEREVEGIWMMHLVL